MKRQANTPLLSLRAVAATVLVAALSGGALRAQDAKGPRPPERGPAELPRFDERDRARWEALPEEDKERLRSGLRQVWTDPQVISAREEVQQASEAYRQAVQEAMARLDPATVPLVREMQRQSEGRSREQLGDGPPGGPGGPGPKGRFRPRVPDRSPAGPPGFLERFPEAEQERFRKAEAAAQQSESVQAARERLDALRDQDEGLRRQRFEAHLELRKALFDEILVSDPGLEEMVASLRVPMATAPDSRGPRDVRRPPGAEKGADEGRGAPEEEGSDGVME